MKRTVDQRIADVRRWVDAAHAVHLDRGRLVPDIARSSGLTPEGVELGFASLETHATHGELEALVAAAGDAPRIHVVLSANVFVAAWRAIALARAAAEHVTLRPSPRDPVLARALVARARDRAITLTDERDVAVMDVDEVHVYGRGEAIAGVRARARPGVVVRGHGPGMGVAVASPRADVGAAARALTTDVITFDQRGCLSPRVAFVVGDEERATAFAAALHEHLAHAARRVPRGALLPEERTDAARWQSAVAFAGRLWAGDQHVVGLAETVAIPPAGRHVMVVRLPSRDSLSATLAPLDRHVVAVGTDDASYMPWPLHARVSDLGQMQRPRPDGPVDRRRPFGAWDRPHHAVGRLELV